MPRYELTVVLTPTLAAEEVEAAIEKMRRLVTARGGAVESDEVLGSRRLAYPIRRQRDGTFVLARFEVPAPAAREVEAGLRMDESVLRHLLIRLPPAPPEEP